MDFWVGLGMLAAGNNFCVQLSYGPARGSLDAPSRAGSDAAGSEPQRAAGSMHAGGRAGYVAWWGGSPLFYVILFSVLVFNNR